MKNTLSRRQFNKGVSTVAAASAAAMVVPHVFAAQDSTVNMVLVGCGGRGTGAISNAFATSGGPVRLVAMADAFKPRLDSSFGHLKNKFADAVDVPEDRKFVGLDAYQKAMDCLKPGDVAVFATPPAFRWVHFQRAVERGLNVFLEKPVTVDGPTTKRIIEINKTAVEKGLKVGVGLMCRHCKYRKELFERIRNGEIGDLITMRAYRMHGPVVFAFSDPKPEGESHVSYQIRRFHSFLWAAGGLYSDFYIHNIDEACWMADKWPVHASALGGRHYRGNFIDQNFDTYEVEYTFDDGLKFFFQGRTINGCQSRFATYVHGSKGMAVVSTEGHAPSQAKIYKGQKMDNSKVVWAAPEEEPNPYQLEWDDLMDAVRNNKPYNELKRGAEVSLVCTMGRMSAHTGRDVTFDQAMNHDHEFAPGLDKLTFDSPPPLPPNADGKTYPVPQPGIETKYEWPRPKPAAAAAPSK